jgi:hypothetical protein
MSQRLNYANVTATLALFFAMSSGAMAAKHYLVNSTKQINPKVLKALKGKEGPPGPKGGNGANGANGKEGPIGKEGKEGAKGPSGATHVTFRQSAAKEVGPNTVGLVSVSCKPGEVATGGGGVNGDTPGVHLKQSYPAPGPEGSTPTGWTVTYENTTGGTVFINADVVCASP